MTAIPAATILFLMGIAFTYYVMLPVALPFLLSFLGIITKVRPSSYIRFVTGVMFWIGIAFQFPLIIYTLAGLGVINARMLVNGWRFAVLGIAIVAAMVTPTVDPINMALVMAPMDWLTKPIGGIEALQAIEVTESIGAFMRVTLLSGLVLSLPYIGIELFAFVNPGLRRR